MSLSINIRQMNDVSVMDVTGRITLGDDARTLRDMLLTMPKEGHKKILLNLAEAAYIDSSGLGVLVSGFASMTNQGGQLKLLNLTKRVRDLLLITKLFTVFEVFDDEELALRSFAEVAVQAPGAVA
ncbi:Anti-sigma factor antagonist [Candidatus Sulfopaludibacter sp. SbA3]|nr:Anti-sigma factor antagonist [Candidatus Sulfopaludibacter sp. SbA3]